MKIVKLKDVAAEENLDEDSLDVIWGLTKHKKYATMEDNARSVANSFGVGLTITDIRQAVKDENRVNVFVNGRYSFSLDVAQVVDLGVKVGKKLTEDELEDLKKASEFGKLYQRTLEWVLMRPRSVSEARQHLYKKLNTPLMVRKKNDDPDGPEYILEKKERFPEEYRGEFMEMIIGRLAEKGYINDQKFAEYYVENRHVKKGISSRRLKMELARKGVNKEMVEETIENSERDDEEEIKKMIARKRKKYNDQKMTAYLCRQGFSYDLVRRLISETSENTEE